MSRIQSSTSTIALLFILSGLRFAVLADIKRQRRWPKITLDCKLMLSGTLALILVTWVLFCASGMA